MNERCFQSVDHPGESSWAYVYGRSLVGPVAACMLPVMVLTLVAILEGVRVMPYVLWAAAAALAAASFWTSFRLRSIVAEVRVLDEFASVQSPWDLVRARKREWEPVLDVRDYGSWMHATIGLSSYEFERNDWPLYEDLARTLAAASGSPDV